MAKVLTTEWWKRKHSPLPLTWNRVWNRCLPGLVALLILLALTKIGLSNALENLAYDALFHLRGSQPWSSELVVIEVDEARLMPQQGEFSHFRYRLTELLNVLERGEPSVVVLDLLATERTPADTKMAEAMQVNGMVVLSQSWDEQGLVLEPVTQLREAAWGIGHSGQQRDNDGIIRQIPLIYRDVPALSVVTANAHRSTADRLSSVPVEDTPLWINWPGPAHLVTHYPLQDVLSGIIPVQAFRDRIVLVGLTTPYFDKLQTPYDRDRPTHGIYLHAAAINNLIEENALHRPGQGIWIIMLLLGGPILSGWITDWRFEYRMGFWLLFSALWSGLGLFLFHQDIWIPIAMPLLLVSLTSIVVATKEQHRINKLLRQSEERYALAVQGSSGGLWDWDLRADRIYFSHRWKEMIGDEMIGDRPKDWYQRVHPDDLASLQEAITNYIGGKSERFENEHRLRHQDGTYRWMLCRGASVCDRQGSPYRMAGSQIDISSRKKVEEKIWRSAYYDELTDLPNRTFFIDQLRRAIADSQKNALYIYAVLLLDVDRFQVVNNSLGNEVGDQLLVAIAHRLKGFFSSQSIIARRSGDEFLILLENIQDQRDTTHTAEQTQQIISLPFHLDGHEVYVSVSIGIALGSGRYKAPEHLLQDADTALHRAKAQGKARYKIFDPVMHNRMVARLKLENDLRRAISNEQRYIDVDESGQPMLPELVLHYQPIFDLTSQRISGFEALSRWQHPTKGFMNPGQFIAMAEETGLIIPLGWWILREACRQMRHWQKQFPDLTEITMSVNLASRQFTMPDLTSTIQLILEETRLSARNLKLEITESTIMDTGEKVTKVLNKLRSLGIRLAIDDFGTGYSSLNYLYQFPINTLKIDRSFISKMMIYPRHVPIRKGDDSTEIVRTIVNLAHNLGMDVTAEGVETMDQCDYLHDMGCEYGQGYYFSKPLTPEAATAILAEASTVTQSAYNSDHPPKTDYSLGNNVSPNHQTNGQANGSTNDPSIGQPRKTAHSQDPQPSLED
ncbi:MAG: EAL domain-containing protein [Cyanobacteria bacterium J06638_20]